MSKKIGVMGSGSVAQVLAAGLAKKGHEVRIGSREPKKLAEFAAKSGIATGTFQEVAAFGEIVILAVKGTVAVEAAQSVASQIAGKVVIDTTNPIADAPPQDGILTYFTGPNDSLLERMQKAVPAARFVKSWSCVGNAFMIDPKLPGGRPTMFIAGDDAAAKKDVSAILDEVGWDVEDVGKAAGARAIEPLCQLWCAPGFLRNDWAHAFKVLKP